MVPVQTESEFPYAANKYMEIDGHRMAYIDEGDGIPILFVHGNPSRSYLWRNVMRRCEGIGRLIAADFMGFGDSDKLDPSLGDDRYNFDAQRHYMFSLWDKLDLGQEVILVLHDCGSMFGFDWARQNSQRVKAIIYMESIAAPLLVSDFPESLRPNVLEMLEQIEKNQFDDMSSVDDFLLGEREFTEMEQAYYRKPFLIPGEERRPKLSFGLPVDGKPEHVVKIVEAYGDFLANSDIPKLMIRANPGHLLTGRLLEFARTWPNQKEVTVAGLHFVQERSPSEIGDAIVSFVRTL